MIRSISMAWMIIGMLLPAAERGVRLVREYKKDRAVLVELSRDGLLVLTSGERFAECAGNTAAKCRFEVLAVHQAATGKQLGELILDQGVSMVVAAFDQSNGVALIQSWYEKTVLYRGFRWDPMSGARTEFQPPDGDKFGTYCIVDGGLRMLGVEREKPWSINGLLALADESGVHPLSQPAVSGASYDFGNGYAGMNQFGVQLKVNCAAWRAGSHYLIQAAGGDRSLYWVSMKPSEDKRFCLSFPDERIHGYAVSPSGNLVAVVTGVGKYPIEGPDYHVYVHVLNGPSCTEQRRIELHFPETPTLSSPLLYPKAKYQNNMAFADEFARQIAISPDDKMIAVTYGVFQDPHGHTYFGLYSLDDGRRLTTLSSDAYKCGILHGALLNDNFECSSAPIRGVVQFSPDSRTLFGTAMHLRQWDVSELK